MDSTPTYPAYLAPYRSGELALRVAAGLRQLRDCHLCPRGCSVNREEAPKGTCETGRYASVVSYFPHLGEEACIKGSRGSGTIFFASCSLRCCFCQNYEISHLGSGEPASPRELAWTMLELQEQGCHNINLVTPTHVVPQILESLELAISRGLRIPLVYNSSGYDRVETLRLLDGIVDIYMPDFKFYDRRVAGLLARAEDYPVVARAAILEMHRQVGDLQLDEAAIARRGLLVRHLVLPNNLAGTYDAMHFLVEEVSPETYVNLMSQYHPAGTAYDIAEISRCISAGEFLGALEDAKRAGIHRFDRLDMPFRFS